METKKEINPYEVLGIDKEKVTDAYAEKMVESKVTELYEAINNILNSNKSQSEKLKEIETMSQELLKYILSYSKVRTEETRADYEKKSDITSIDQEVEESIKKSKKALKIEKINSNGTPTKVNAYQILGVSHGKVTDKGIELRTIQCIAFAMPKRPPEGIEEIGKRLTNVQRFLWAYDKTKTEEKRKTYDGELRYSEMAKEAIKNTSIIGEIVNKTRKQPDIVELQKEEGIPSITITEVGRMYNKVFCEEEEVSRYIIEKRDADKIQRRTIYSEPGGINMNRLRYDSQYFEAAKKILLDDRLMDLSTRFLGGYIGRLTEKTDEEGNIQLEQIFTPESVTLCKYYQRQKSSAKNAKKSEQQPKKQNSGDQR